MPAKNTKNTQNLNPLKEQFLEALQNAESLSDALEACAMPKSMLCNFLFKDKKFQKDFDKIINLKLEIALLETALKSKAAGILSFSLTNRLPKKYNKARKEDKQESPAGVQQIVYVQEETSN